MRLRSEGQEARAAWVGRGVEFVRWARRSGFFLRGGTWGSGCFLILTLVLTAGAAGLEAQVTCMERQGARVTPAYFHDGDGDGGVGIRLAAQHCRLSHDIRPRFARSTYLGGSFKAAVPFTELNIPQNAEAFLEVGVSVSLSERAPIDLDDDPDDPDVEAFRFDYGFGGLSARLQYESNTDLTEHALVGGAALQWVDPARPWLPSLVVTGEAVRPVRSDIREALELDREVHGRIGLRGYWLVPLARSLQGELDTAYFWTTGLESLLREAGWDRGPYLSTGLGWILDRRIGGEEWLLLESISVSHAWGQRPTGPPEERGWMVGISVGTGSR